MTVDGDDEALLVDGVDALGRWSQGLDLTQAKARKLVRDLGSRLWKVALGESGADHLASLAPTAILLGVDETVLNLPWELIGATRDELALAVPFGRVGQHQRAAEGTARPAVGGSHGADPPRREPQR